MFMRTLRGDLFETRATTEQNHNANFFSIIFTFLGLTRVVEAIFFSVICKISWKPRKH